MATSQLGTPEPALLAQMPHGCAPWQTAANSDAAAALAEMMPHTYEELRRLAAAYLRGEHVEHTLQLTAVLDEAYLNLLGQSSVQCEHSGHLVVIFARVMRQTLSDLAAVRSCVKRGGADRMSALIEYYERQKVDVSALDEALEALAAQDDQQARIVELRFFGGLTLEQIAQVLEISLETVKRDWTIAKMWLHRELSQAA